MNNELSKHGPVRDHEWLSKKDPKWAPKMSMGREENKKCENMCYMKNKGPTNMPLFNVDHEWNDHE